MPHSLIQLRCGVNSYDWGKKGIDSCAARYAAATAPAGFLIQSDQPYAEVSLVETSTQMKLCFGNLSLSIQAHPDKALAKQLHASDPVNYPDDNHKPEMAIAITPFEALCGFRPLDEISHFLEHVPALRSLVGQEEATTFQRIATTCSSNGTDEAKQQGKQALRKIFAKVMNADEDQVQSASESLVMSARSDGDRFTDGGVAATSGEVLSELVSRLYDQYGADRGLFVLFFTNYVTLAPGEAIFLRADDIHAYISGDIAECMATSDNVVRAGFTARFKDVPTLVDMLTYNCTPFAEQQMDPTDYDDVGFNAKGRKSGSFATLYDPPIGEFAVARCVLKANGAAVTFSPLNGPSIIIVTRGMGTISVGSTALKLKEGYVFFIGASAECAVCSQGDGELEMYKAFCEVSSTSTTQ
ncbi:uncharacterized protein E0L32_001295 [Thyridium curvatum]|uniref:Mannose-6-phosphate isomerase n=1 Tax=Thyridium curvatum TaxID=1093900 RepID=A0A507AZ67_9PEZI|nr:uncharacterized protein E0L32_001295 [Thyridium curvatum]TPX10098.1 hypothetical protein E0L32_001295 [Thyridium curvatum]